MQKKPAFHSKRMNRQISGLVYRLTRNWTVSDCYFPPGRTFATGGVRRVGGQGRQRWLAEALTAGHQVELNRSNSGCRWTLPAG
jgi:hypothetical protein